MATKKLASLVVEVIAKPEQFVRGMEKAQAKANKFGASMNKMGISARGLATSLAAVGAAGVGIGYLTKKVFDLGSATAEIESKFRTVFGESSDQVAEFANDYGAMAGLVQSRTKDLLATTAAMVQGMGFAREESAEFATQVLKLSGDLASFNNMPTADVMNAIRSATVGEREELKQLGIVIREADVQQRALNISSTEAAENLTDQEKATATLQLITERAGVAVGDLARTSDSAANKAKQIDAKFANIAETFAADMLPTLEQLLPVIEDIADKFANIAPKAAAFFTTMVQMVGLADPVFQATMTSLENLGGDLDMLRDREERLRDEVLSTNEALKQANEELESTPVGFPGYSDAFAEVGRLKDELADLESEYRAVSTVVGQAEAMAGLASDAGEAADKVDNATDAVRKLDYEIVNLSEPGKMLSFAEMLERRMPSIGQFSQPVVEPIVEPIEDGMSQVDVLWRRGLENLQDATAAFIGDTARDFLGLFNTMENDTRSQLERIADLFSNFGNRILNIMLEIGAQKLATGFMKAVGIGVAVPTAAQGGVVGSIKPTKIVEPSVFAGAPHFSRGGIVGDEVPIIAHRGETVVPRGASTSAPITVNQSITFAPQFVDGADGARWLASQKGTIARIMVEAAQDSYAVRRALA